MDDIHFLRFFFNPSNDCHVPLNINWCSTKHWDFFFQLYTEMVPLPIFLR